MGHELLDASPLAVEVAHKLTANPEFYEFAAQVQDQRDGMSKYGAAYPEINDLCA